MKEIIKPFIKEIWKYLHRTNALKLIIVTDVFYYYYDYADYSSRRLKCKQFWDIVQNNASYDIPFGSLFLWILKTSSRKEQYGGNGHTKL